MVQSEFLGPAKVHPYFRRDQFPENRRQSPTIFGGKYYEKKQSVEPPGLQFDRRKGVHHV
jgi:hypothetical protein